MVEWGAAGRAVTWPQGIAARARQVVRGPSPWLALLGGLTHRLHTWAAAETGSGVKIEIEQYQQYLRF